MQTIRTTITLPTNIYQDLRSKAFRYHKSFNAVVVDKLCEKPEKEYKTQSVEKRAAERKKFFKQVGKMGNQIDWMEAIREERNR